MLKSRSFAIVLAVTLVALCSAPALAQLRDVRDFEVQREDGLTDMGQGQGNPHMAVRSLAPRTIFVTSMAYDGDLGGLQGADQKCQALADASNSIVPPGEYVALLSTSTVNANSRMPHSIGPVIRPDGTLVAGNFAELFRAVSSESAGNLLGPPNIDELGVSVVGGYAWTGSSPQGLMRPESCDDWASDSISDEGVSGIPATRNASWIAREAEPDTCNKALRLYCVEK